MEKLTKRGEMEEKQIDVTYILIIITWNTLTLKSVMIRQTTDLNKNEEQWHL